MNVGEEVEEVGMVLLVGQLSHKLGRETCATSSLACFDRVDPVDTPVISLSRVATDPLLPTVKCSGAVLAIGPLIYCETVLW